MVTGEVAGSVALMEWRVSGQVGDFDAAANAEANVDAGPPGTTVGIVGAVVVEFHGHYSDRGAGNRYHDMLGLKRWSLPLCIGDGSIPPAGTEIRQWSFSMWRA